MAIEFIQFSAATATDGVLVAADIVDNIGTATGVSVQTIKFGYGTDGVYNEVATGQGLPMATGPVYQIQQMSTATSPVDVTTWSATGIVTIVNAGTATIPVSMATTATQPVAVTNWSATDLNVNLAQTATVAITGTINVATSATQPVEVTSWTATDLNVNLAQTATVAITGSVEVNQATATALHAVVHPLGLRDTSNWVYNSVTATAVATFATGAGTNNFNDLVAIYLSNGATTQQTARIRSSSTATVFTMTLAPDGGGFIWQPIKPLPQAVANTGWDIQIENAITTPGITVTALFEQTT